MFVSFVGVYCCLRWLFALVIFVVFTVCVFGVFALFGLVLFAFYFGAVWLVVT